MGHFEKKEGDILHFGYSGGYMSTLKSGLLALGGYV